MDIKQTNKKWYAVYTKSRNEKKVNELLAEKGIESYLPLQKTLKQWSDRKKFVEEPLFRSYIFVRIDYKHHIDVLQTQGVVTFVKFAGKPEPVPDKQIEAVKMLLAENYDFEVTNENLKIGDKVEVTQGAMKGLQGELVEYRGKKKVVIRIDTIGQNLLVDIPAAYVRIL